ncbi:MAG: hypothetical protein ACK4KV_07205 [Rhodocyclaceae bacterium]
MLVLRLFAVLAVLGIGGALIAWLLTGDPRYKAFAWNLFRVALVIIFVVLALFVLERMLIPIP